MTDYTISGSANLYMHFIICTSKMILSGKPLDTHLLRGMEISFKYPFPKVAIMMVLK